MTTAALLNRMAALVSGSSSAAANVAVLRANSKLCARPKRCSWLK